jgi:nucleoside-diphosphate-sugar epimerase
VAIYRSPEETLLYPPHDAGRSDLRGLSDRGVHVQSCKCRFSHGVMLQSGPALLLTGATGLIGSELRERLLATKPARRIIALSRQQEKIRALNLLPGVVAVSGDVTHPLLALSPRSYAKLAASVTEVVHCAAATRFGLPLEQARATNTQGTRNVLALARRCSQLEKFVHLSTVYVVGRAAGHFAEVPVRHPNGFTNTYQQSKYEAEELVVEAMNDIPAAVFRLSSVFGNSETGCVRQFNYTHQLLRLFPRNLLPLVPGEPDAPIDLVSTDWATAALAYLFEFGFAPGKIYHLCAGRDHSLTLREIIDLTVSIFESHPVGRRWLPIRVPELVSLSRYEAYAHTRRREGDKLLNGLLRALGYFVPHLAIVQTFENKNAAHGLAPSGLRCPPVRDYFAKVVQYCLETNWGRQVGQAVRS